MGDEGKRVRDLYILSLVKFIAFIYTWLMVVPTSTNRYGEREGLKCIIIFCSFFFTQLAEDDCKDRNL